ncbi:hypothetical protein ABN763_02170 [Spongiivirga sp. MCCC 1A20706]|uniref:hypothetical protein n=1 Tax=Spongiivirga sp. MCCC 1A20706 TaxID=3160963 RepID=UPI0039775958
MKSRIKQLSLLLLGIFILFTSCQNESVEETDPQTAGDLVTQNSEVANLVLNMAARDGSFDNILDRNHCTQIKLPVTVVVRDIEITLDSEEDLETIERLFDEFEDDLDELDFLFPITIILADHTEVVIENEDQLEALIEECEEDDDDIECIDFEYPITISVFNENEEQIGTETFENDEQLFRFFKNLAENEFVSFNFPMVLVDSEGERVTINDNDELKEAIRVARNECDEDDDDDYNDDDFSIERLENYLVECPFTVQHFVRDDNDLTDDYFRYIVDFKEDGTLVASRMQDGVPVNGEWEVTEGENGRPVLLINLGQLTDFNNEWLVYEIDDDKIKLFDEGSRIILHQKCEDDEEEGYTEEELDAIIKECSWEVAAFNLNGNDITAQYMGYNITFKEDQTVSAVSPNSTDAVSGSWSTQGGNEGEVFFLWDMAEPLQDLMNDWKLYELDEERVKFIAGDSYVILERNCENNNETCDTMVVAEMLETCKWRVAKYDGSNGFDDFLIDFSNRNIHAFINGNVEDEGNWDITESTINFNDLFANLQVINGNWTVTECGDDRLVMFNAEQKELILEKDCESSTDGDIDAILSYLQQGEWKVADYDDSAVPGTDEMDYDIYTFTFTADGKMVATNPNMVETEGTYDVFRDDSGTLKFEVLDFVQPDLLEMLDGEFDIVKAEENRIEIFVEYSQSTKKVVYEKI